MKRWYSISVALVILALAMFSCGGGGGNSAGSGGNNDSNMAVISGKMAEPVFLASLAPIVHIIDNNGVQVATTHTSPTGAFTVNVPAGGPYSIIFERPWQGISLVCAYTDNSYNRWKVPSGPVSIGTVTFDNVGFARSTISPTATPGVAGFSQPLANFAGYWWLDATCQWSSLPGFVGTHLLADGTIVSQGGARIKISWHNGFFSNADTWGVQTGNLLCTIEYDGDFLTFSTRGRITTMLLIMKPDGTLSGTMKQDGWGGYSSATYSVVGSRR